MCEQLTLERTGLKVIKRLNQNLTYYLLLNTPNQCFDNCNAVLNYKTSEIYSEHTEKNI